ncbi:MAG: hypothetical protein OXI35_05855 [Gemmatimonadota bacterium]|nr:hypothetical protein [Gemmatimonadota bacterium]
MITTEQFEHKLIEYLDGELSDAEKREVAEYLQAHPEAIDLKGDFSLLCAAGKSIRESTFPADLLLESNRKLAARLADSRREDVASTPVASSNGSPGTVLSRTWLPNWRRRLRPPVLAAALAALAILFVGVTQRAALADIANSLLQIVVTLNDEPLSDSQQQAFDELVEITETVDEDGEQLVTINMDGDQLFQEFGDGVLEVMVSDDENNEAVSSNLVDSLLTELGADADQAIIVVGPPGAHTAFEISLDEKPIFFDLDSLRAAKIGSQSPGVTEYRWGEIKKIAGSSTDDSP